MSNPFIICAVFYLASFWFAMAKLKEDKPQAGSKGSQRNLAYRILALLSIFLHAYVLYRTILLDGEWVLSLGRIFSIAAWMSVTCYWLISCFKQQLNLGIFVLPIGLFGLILGHFFPGPVFLFGEFNQNGSLGGVSLHILLAVPTYGFFCLGFVQAVLLFIQEKRLRQRNPGAQLRFLPPIETMERNLFWFNTIGFMLLTISLIGGLILAWKHQSFSINHHILFSVVAWLCFSFLLAGRTLFGWRGAHAAKWTMFSFGILVLGYFGTRFVRDIILNS